MVNKVCGWGFISMQRRQEITDYEVIIDDFLTQSTAMASLSLCYVFRHCESSEFIVLYYVSQCAHYVIVISMQIGSVFHQFLPGEFGEVQ